MQKGHKGQSQPLLATTLLAMRLRAQGSYEDNLSCGVAAAINLGHLLSI